MTTFALRAFALGAAGILGAAPASALTTPIAIDDAVAFSSAGGVTVFDLAPGGFSASGTVGATGFGATPTDFSLAGTVPGDAALVALTGDFASGIDPAASVTINRATVETVIPPPSALAMALALMLGALGVAAMWRRRG
ncbi:MAG: hypothetical protein ACFBWO_14140 [Paracoccaceae bacterium]